VAEDLQGTWKLSTKYLIKSTYWQEILRECFEKTAAEMMVEEEIHGHG
jgi:hypothetical protein